MQASCRNAGFFRKKDRSSDLAELETALAQQQQQHRPNKSIPPSATDRELAPRVSCSDRRVAPRQAWVESLITANLDEAYLDPPNDLVDLHPDVFAVFPRLDLVHKNLYWQAHYRLVVSSYLHYCFIDSFIYLTNFTGKSLSAFSFPKAVHI